MATPYKKPVSFAWSASKPTRLKWRRDLHQKRAAILLALTNLIFSPKSPRSLRLFGDQRWQQLQIHGKFIQKNFHIRMRLSFVLFSTWKEKPHRGPRTSPPPKKPQPK